MTMYKLEVLIDGEWRRIASGRDKEGLLVFVLEGEQYRIVEAEC